MKDGEIVQIGQAEEILQNPADDYVREFTNDVNRARIITASTIMRIQRPLLLKIRGENCSS
jgi:glycine betaine/proline transport system ATP-binding protein